MTELNQMSRECLDIIEKNKIAGNKYNEKINWKELTRSLTKKEMQKSHEDVMNILDKYEYLVIRKLKKAGKI